MKSHTCSILGSAVCIRALAFGHASFAYAADPKRAAEY